MLHKFLLACFTMGFPTHSVLVFDYTMLFLNPVQPGIRQETKANTCSAR